ncbi:hypothetical protein SAMN02910447_02731 [Ruminococcus sp. YE71]|nr:hypothetical protein SAMN02910446_02717 [Ruminococcus sp. YE78]SFW44657.1 hypothetical protein SAMN02910447_02731 [Ruminococcus sp. YE71]
MDKAVKTIMDNRSGEYDRKSRYRAVLRIPAFLFGAVDTRGYPLPFHC